MTSDEDLMLACRGGSATAFEELFRRYRQPMWGYFRRRVADPAVAEDLAQETFLAVLKGASRYQPLARFRTYMYGIAHNLLAANRRQRHRDATEPLANDVAAPHAPSEDDALWIRQAVGRLDPDDREIVMLREFEQLSYQEIATVLDLPLNTVRSRLFRARLDLARLLAPESEGRR